MLKKTDPLYQPKQTFLSPCWLMQKSLFWAPGASCDNVITQFGHYKNWPQRVRLVKNVWTFLNELCKYYFVSENNCEITEVHILSKVSDLWLIKWPRASIDPCYGLYIPRLAHLQYNIYKLVWGIFSAPKLNQLTYITGGSRRVNSSYGSSDGTNQSTDK